MQNSTHHYGTDKQTNGQDPYCLSSLKIATVSE